MHALRLAAVLACATSTALAQEPPTGDASPPSTALRSGPERGVDLPALRVAALVGAEAGSEFDLAARAAEGPLAVLFVHELTRNVAPLLRAFDEHCAALAVLGLRGHQVLLSGDRTAAEQRVPIVSRALGLASPLLLSVDGQEGPGGYALHRKAELTLVLADAGKVVAAVPFVDTGAGDVDLLELHVFGLMGAVPAEAELRAAIAASLPQDREQIIDRLVRLERLRRAHVAAGARLQEQLRDRGQDQPQRRMRDGGRPERMQQDAGPERPTTPLQLVTDEGLGAALRRIVRRDADAAALDAAFAALEARLAEEPRLAEQARTAARRLLDETDYGNDAARDRLRTWLGR